MMPKILTLSVSLILVGMLFGLPGIIATPEAKAADKTLCEKMLRFGMEAYQRGKYLDAKEYFRKAVQADSTSSQAWRFYDQAVIFALAEKVEKDSKLTMPDVSTREETPKGQAAPPPAPQAVPAPKPSPEKKEEKKEGEFKIIKDEGC